MKQGDIYLINLDPAIHSAIGKTRPGMILSINAMNLHSPRLIIAKDSKIMLDQMRSVDKRRLTRRIGMVDHELLMKACAIAQKLINVPSAGK
ncbi:MAG: type II toxin-antitoxin system PemK/MazF family toxin [Deltaproteobacteria bacterium]|nr:type II toxin-antitoxin system PemK/MazF family toxin [Deltaproteobacteria bacterium]